ncbi:MAG: fused MFS/spermidine synthase [Deltaproteobacteria bacterium]|nr:fused MFS/spermidine synthase [Deltaproteobacteria bacterium]MBN2671617.1 fused MFS/spermidine synthase [Deltaproteobacteria bacterium]
MHDVHTQTTASSASPVQASVTPTALVPLFFFVSLLSAFLLFLVQPIVGKTILPFFGGSAAVWTTCLLFFQSTLLAGYAYAHTLSTIVAAKWQVIVHTCILAMSILFASFLPDAPVLNEPPVAGVLLTLTRHVGIPFFALSTTAPLLQHWFFAAFPQRSPYPLYAISNAGSFAAVLSYPFWVERFFPLQRQEQLWGIGFALFVIGCISCAVIALRFSSKTPQYAANNAALPNTTELPAPTSPWLWFGLSGAGSVLLLTTTEQISQDVAATPLFWMIPLCIYLLTYVVCFSKDNQYRRFPWLIALLAACVLVVIQLFMGGRFHLSLQLGLYVVTLAVGCMVAHGELAAVKPSPSELTRFYLWTSAGGIFGGILVAVIAPFLFPDLWEYSLFWPMFFFLVWRAVSGSSRSFEASLAARKTKWLLLAGLLIMSVTFIVDVVYDALSPVYTSRNFFGRLTISETPKTKCLYHGRTLHGCEPKKTRPLIPAFYYGPGSGVGVSYRFLSLPPERPLRTGIVGLGVGLCATWNRENDHMRFYEINPDVIRLAQTEFDYLNTASGTIDVVQGDARLSLATENQQNNTKLDLLVLDAFSSDAIPLHLLTREAFNIYRERITVDGILAFHISNRHLDLEPLMLGAANHLNWSVFIITNDVDYSQYLLDTTWVILTNNETFIREFRDSEAYTPWPTQYQSPLLFTDQYSNIMDLL